MNTDSAYTPALAGNAPTVSEARHTLGPWLIGPPTALRPTFTIYNRPFGLGDIAEAYCAADARLIAAAPKMLAALRRLFLAADESGAVLAASEDDLCAAANDADADAIVREQAAAVLECRAAIAAATGTQP
jgi:hypothetical protein